MCYLVGFYEIDRRYGGPEEGGWWYDCGELVRLMKDGVFFTKEEAYEYANRANRVLGVIQKRNRSVGSIIYSGGRHAARVYENELPDHFPAERPYYS